MSEPEVSIACTLDDPSFKDRMADIRALMDRSLRGSTRAGRHLHLTFDAAARADVEDMVRKEKTCCAFLDFELAERDGAIELTIAAPPTAADDLFAPFQKRTA